MLMQKRRETRKNKARTSVIYLRCLISRFFFFSFIFVFFSFIRCLFFFFFVFVSLLDRINLKRLSTLLAAQLVFFHCFAVKRVLRQTITACDRVKHSVDDFDGVFGENIRFSVYIEISESRGISCAVQKDGPLGVLEGLRKMLTLVRIETTFLSKHHITPLIFR